MAAGAPRRRPVSKKGPTGGSGGQKKKGLTGRGPTPKAEDRSYHKKAGRPAGQSGKRPTASGAPRASGGARTGRPDNRPMSVRRPDNAPELLVGRNPVVESLRAGVPGTALYVATGMDPDERVSEAIQAAAGRGIALLEVGRSELDRMTGGLLHQGLALQVPPYEYAHPDDLLRRSFQRVGAPLLVALDGIQDPRNLGAVVRSAAAFGADGVLVPERRAAGITASAWRTSAGAAARIPVARAVNLARALVTYRKAGLLVVGLAGDGGTDLFDLEAATEPLVVVAGSEGKGMSRLVTEACDVTVRIPITSAAESLNASVALSIALAEIRRRRRV